eukprot:jgi/Bigna1/81940/fgenesh1_pg.86_\
MAMFGDGKSVSLAGFLGLAHSHFYELKELLDYLGIPTSSTRSLEYLPAGQLSSDEIKREELCELIMMSNSGLAPFSNVDKAANVAPADEFKGSSSIFNDLSSKADPVIQSFRVRGLEGKLPALEESREKKKSSSSSSWFSFPLFGDSSSSSSTKKWGTVHEIQSEEELDQILMEDLSQTVVLECTFTWCRACKSFSRKYDKWAALYPKVRFLKAVGNLNESSKRLCKERLGVTFAPVFFTFRGGRILATHRGINENQFRDFLRADLRPEEIP